MYKLPGKISPCPPIHPLSPCQDALMPGRWLELWCFYLDVNYHHPSWSHSALKTQMNAANELPLSVHIPFSLYGSTTTNTRKSCKFLWNLWEGYGSRHETMDETTTGGLDPGSSVLCLSRGSMYYFKEFWCCTEPRQKWNKIILATKIILLHFRLGSVQHQNSLK